MEVNEQAKELNGSIERKKFLASFIPGSLFVLMIWFIKILEIAFETKLFELGIYPRSASGLIGVFTSPLIHSDIEHLFSNSIPLIVLSTGLIYFYPKVSFKVFSWLYLATGFWVWSFARESYHIGASGLVYGMASFLFFSGFINKKRSLMAIALLVVFLYGSLIWGVLPIKETISYESHALGALMGLLLAFYFRDKKPIVKSNRDSINTSSTFESGGVIINYEYKA